jgi:hypothetical protein
MARGHRTRSYADLDVGKEIAFACDSKYHTVEPVLWHGLLAY